MADNMMEALKNKVSENQIQANPDVINQQVPAEEEKLDKKDLAVMKKALTQLIDITSNNPKLESIISELKGLYKEGLKSAGITEEKGIEFASGNMPASEVVNGMNGTGFNQNVM